MIETLIRLVPYYLILGGACYIFAYLHMNDSHPWSSAMPWITLLWIIVVMPLAVWFASDAIDHIVPPWAGYLAVAVLVACSFAGGHVARKDVIKPLKEHVAEAWPGAPIASHR